MTIKKQLDALRDELAKGAPEELRDKVSRALVISGFEKGFDALASQAEKLAEALEETQQYLGSGCVEYNRDKEPNFSEQVNEALASFQAFLKGGK
jgi:soluble cytochrome b562